MDDNYLNIDQHLFEAYMKTKYHLLNTPVYIQIGALNSDLDSFLIDNNAYTWCFISSDNPQSNLLSPEENDQKYQLFKKDMDAKGIRFWPGIGTGTDSDWPPERSLLLLDVSKKVALELAKYYDQKAIVYGQINREAKLLICG